MFIAVYAFILIPKNKYICQLASMYMQVVALATLVIALLEE